LLKLSSAVKSQVPKVTSKEAYSLLKNIYSYFDTIMLDDDLKENALNFHSAKAIILSYYTLNDLLLGYAVGDKESKKEAYQLETALHNLTKETSFKIKIEELIASVDKTIHQTDLKSYIDNARGVFKEELTSFLASDK
jgi:hypothetical protein